MICNIDSLNKFYGRKQVLKDVSLSLDSHIYGILGEKGAGKTTLLRCICGLNSYKGKIEFGCQKNEISYLPQNFPVFENMTIKENLEFMAGFKRKKADWRVFEIEIPMLIDQIGMTKISHRKPGTLSAEMRCRLGLAQSLLCNPKLLLLDAPAAGLDPEERIQFGELVECLCKGRCVLLATDAIQDVENLCDEVIVLHQGEVQFMGEVEAAADFAAEKGYRILKQ